MTPPARVWPADVRCVLFDFDGPICHLFHEYSTALVAKRVFEVLEQEGAPRARFDGARNMHRLLRLMRADQPAGDVPTYLLTAEAELTRQEEEAVTSAKPTPHLTDLVRSLTERGIDLGIASNNSFDAITQYLRRHELTGYFQPNRVIGRAADPALMKPHPHSLLRALDEIGAVDRETCVLVGDSLDDARAAVSAGIGFIGYVHPSVQAGNGRGRYRVEQQSEALRAAGARVVVSELRTLVREMH